MKFPYPEIPTVSEHGLRLYVTPVGHLPSITTILGLTTPPEKKTSLESWRTSLGHAKADQVTQDAAGNGSAVHLLAERYLSGQDLQASSFSPTALASFNGLKLKLNKVDEVWGQEMALYSDLLGAAGRCDCAGLYKGIPSIIDFKTSLSLKGEDRISDYKLQVCAYAEMHNELFQTDIRQGVILMTSAGGFPQEFIVDLPKYVTPLKKRISEFYESLQCLQS